MAPAKYLMTVETQEGAKRQPMTMRYHYCEEHVPWEKVHPSSDGQPDLPANPISAREAADLIGVSLMTLHHWRGRGKGPKSTKARGRCWYNRDQVERYAEAYRMVNGGEGR
ncbi:helix-turn-helix domain-containing protein [Streptomyces tuirus]|uniref:helix-turn-helix transcriptional regulator n=1 Tax=Streptomyces tuirus TaxID=68278 RepID=UPI0034382997